MAGTILQTRKVRSRKDKAQTLKLVKAKYTFKLWLSNFIPEYTPREMSVQGIEDLHKNAHKSFIQMS